MLKILQQLEQGVRSLAKKLQAVSPQKKFEALQTVLPGLISTAMTTLSKMPKRTLELILPTKEHRKAIVTFARQLPAGAATTIGSIVSMALNANRLVLMPLLTKSTSTIAQTVGVLGSCFQVMQTWLITNQGAIMDSIRNGVIVGAGAGAGAGAAAAAFTGKVVSALAPVATESKIAFIGGVALGVTMMPKVVFLATLAVVAYLTVKCTQLAVTPPAERWGGARRNGNNSLVL